MPISVTQLKVGDTYASRSGKGGVRTITFMGTVRGDEGVALPNALTYIERHPRNVPYTHNNARVTVDTPSRDASTLYITTRGKFAKWAQFKVLVEFDRSGEGDGGTE